MLVALIALVIVFGWLFLRGEGRVDSLLKRVRQLEFELDCNGRVLDQFTSWLNSPQGMVSVLEGKLSRSTADAACWDVYSRVDLVINPGESAIVPTGLVTEMYAADALLLDRSGLAAKFRVTRRAGVIDAKYPDEWGVVLVNEGKLPYQVLAGDRIAQALFIPKFLMQVNAVGPNAVVETTDAVRAGGFGSTGK